MIDDVVGNYLDNLEEREFDAPFISLLRAMGFYDIHFLHGPFEFGKDFIAKKKKDRTTEQFAFQTKAGDLGLSEWRACRSQIDQLRTNSLAHPSFDLGLFRRAVFVTTGRLTGGAPLDAQDYSEHIAQLGELDFEIWDREDLIEFISKSPEIGLAGAASGALLSLVGKIDELVITDSELEKFSQRWFASEDDACIARGCLEAAVIANRLRLCDRPDLAAYTSLCLVRAAWVRGHESQTMLESSTKASDIGRNLFRQYARDLFNRCGKEVLDPTKFAADHVELPIIVTYPIRCLKILEILGLLGLLEEGAEPTLSRETAAFLADFCKAHPGSQHPVSDHWAVCLVAPVLLLSRTGHTDTVRRLLQGVIRWIGDRYEGDNVGLAGVWSKPEDEIAYLLGNPFSHIKISRRSESYASTIVLDLAAILGFSDIYELARNDFLAVNTFPAVLEVPDSKSQYLLSAPDIRVEPNVPYKEGWEPQERWKVSPHHLRGPSSLYLERIGRPWDVLAVISVLRDRHFVTVLRSFVESSN